jgi:hypothetical protein
MVEVSAQLLAPLDEYKSVNENMRHYSNMRFAQLTLYFGLSAALLTVVLAEKAKPYTQSMAVGAVITTAVFWLLERRAADYWHHFCRRASELEDVLSMKQWRTRPARRVFSATRAVEFLLLVAGAYWILVALGRGVLGPVC